MTVDQSMIDGLTTPDPQDKPAGDPAPVSDPDPAGGEPTKDPNPQPFQKPQPTLNEIAADLEVLFTDADMNDVQQEALTKKVFRQMGVSGDKIEKIVNRMFYSDEPEAPTPPVGEGDKQVDPQIQALQQQIAALDKKAKDVESTEAASRAATFQSEWDKLTRQFFESDPFIQQQLANAKAVSNDAADKYEKRLMAEADQHMRMYCSSRSQQTGDDLNLSWVSEATKYGVNKAKELAQTFGVAPKTLGPSSGITDTFDAFMAGDKPKKPENGDPEFSKKMTEYSTHATLEKLLGSRVEV